MKIAVLLFDVPCVHLLDVMDGLVEDAEIGNFLSEQGYDLDHIQWVAGEDIPVKNLEFSVSPEIRLAKTIQENGTAIPGGYRIHFRGFKMDVSLEDGPHTIVVTDAEAGESPKDPVELTVFYPDAPESESMTLHAGNFTSEQLELLNVHIEKTSIRH